MSLKELDFSAAMVKYQVCYWTVTCLCFPLLLLPILSPLLVYPFSKKAAHKWMDKIDRLVQAYREWRDWRLLKNLHNKAYLFEIIKDPTKAMT